MYLGRQNELSKNRGFLQHWLWRPKTLRADVTYCANNLSYSTSSFSISSSSAINSDCVISSSSFPPENILLSLHSRPRNAVTSFAASSFADPHLNFRFPVAEEQVHWHSVQLSFLEENCAVLLGNCLTFGYSVESIHQIVIQTLLPYGYEG